jgi:hypothetical protein
MRPDIQTGRIARGFQGVAFPDAVGKDYSAHKRAVLAMLYDCEVTNYVRNSRNKPRSVTATSFSHQIHVAVRRQLPVLRGGLGTSIIKRSQHT